MSEAKLTDDHWYTCPECDGYGGVWGEWDEAHTCTECGGEGAMHAWPPSYMAHDLLEGGNSNHKLTRADEEEFPHMHFRRAQEWEVAAEPGYESTRWAFSKNPIEIVGREEMQRLADLSEDEINLEAEYAVLDEWAARFEGVTKYVDHRPVEVRTEVQK